MSKINREEALRALYKIANIVIYEEKDVNHKETMFTDNPEEFNLIKEYINQQSQLSEDVEEIIDNLEECIIKAKTYSYPERNNMFDTIKQHIQVQASEIERLKQELHRAKIDYGYDITEKGMANKELKDKLNAQANEIEELQEKLLELQRYSNLQIDKLNAIREAIRSQYNYGTKEKVYDQIKQILKEQEQ